MLLLLPPSACLVDAALTLAARSFRSERWWTPHVAHAYQRWAKALGRHFPVTFAYAAWSIAGGLLALGIRDLSDAFIMYAGSAWYLVVGNRDVEAITELANAVGLDRKSTRLNSSH